MRQNIPSSIPDLMGLGGAIKIGAEQYGATIPLLHNTPQLIGQDVDGLTNGRANYENARNTLAEQREGVKSIMVISRGALTLGRDLLKPVLGSEYNERWDRLGLVGSLAIPRLVTDVEATLTAFKGFFTANQGLESGAHNITAQYFGDLQSQLFDRRTQSNLQAKVSIELREVRDAAAAKLRKRIRMVINEMTDRIDPLDPIWVAFGLKMPGADKIPDTPTDVKVTLIGPTAAAVKWDVAGRAEYYRVWKKVVGVDEEPVTVGSPAVSISQSKVCQPMQRLRFTSLP